MLGVAPLVSAVRALLALIGADEPSWYWILFAVGGSLSGIGMVLAAVATWRSGASPFVVTGAAVALVGHNVVSRIGAIAVFGASLVHLGASVVLYPWVRWAPVAGAVAALGAWLRHHHAAGDLLLLAGSLGLLAAVVAATRAAGPAAPDRRAQPA